MKKKTILLTAIMSLTCLCTAFTACTAPTKLQEQENKGYVVKVTYDGNGGKFLNRDGVTLIDMFNPKTLDEDGDGKVEIKLTEPTDSNRPNSGGTGVELTRPGYFFSGWYSEREIVKNADGNALDDDGNVLEEKEGGYYRTEVTTQEKDGEIIEVTTLVKTIPAYTYSGYWDFSNDKIEYEIGSGKHEMKLYAGWVKYYEFNYYYQKDGVWTKYATTNFDYKTTNANEKFSDKDTIWTPVWEDGKMQYARKYNSGDTYTFPEVPGMTFDKAYTDEECTNEITGSLEHHGELNIENGQAKNRIQNVYVTLLEGERFKISTADQLARYGKATGYYEILNDLDFTNVNWPAGLTIGSFSGKFTAANPVTIKNATAVYSSTTATSGGLFGRVLSGAEIKNVKFENATLDVSEVANKSDQTFGLFTGDIDDNAKVENVSIDGTVKVGKIRLGSGYEFNLLANGNLNGITKGAIKLQVYGNELTSGKYWYSIDYETVTVDKNGNVTFEFKNRTDADKPIYDIVITEV